ncbi:DUF6879 family protein [Nocardiopsis flavescens]|uniref:DUF6879 family protein n=1 Tax=Nocardiopsis flavescens TaxID=758803 RepID=UPI00365359CC
MPHVPMTRPLLPVPDALSLAARHGTLMDQRRYSAEEATDRHSGSHRVCWVWDPLAHLHDPANPACVAWSRGQQDVALHLLAGEIPALAARLQTHRGLGLRVRTLWAPQSPRTPYQHYRAHELNTHTRAGFDVRTVPAHLLRPSGPGHRLPPLVAYPDHAVYLLHHTAQGRPDGATRITDPGLLSALGAALARLGRAAEPL